MNETFPARLRAAFEVNMASGVEVGAAVSVWRGGTEVFRMSDGFRDAARTSPWTDDTLVLIWSATKGLAATCVLRCVDEAGLGLDAPLAEFWPEFAAGGKSRLTIGQVMSHVAGLGALRKDGVSILDHAAVASALAEQEPFGEALGCTAYGPRTSGFLMDEIVRRLTGGETLGDYWIRNFAEPLGLDLWIGLPEEEDSRVAAMLAARSSGDVNDPFFIAFSDARSLTRRAFSTPSGLGTVTMMNQPSARRASVPSMGGIGSASSLAKFYAVLASAGMFEGRRYFSDRVFGWMTTRRSQGFDKILRADLSFSAGLMMDPLDGEGRKLRCLMGPSLSGFGHPGAGGSLAFADPEAGVGFAYVMNQMEAGVLPGRRAQALVKAFYGLSAE